MEKEKKEAILYLTNNAEKILYCKHCDSNNINFEENEADGFPIFLQFIGKCNDCGKETELCFIQSYYKQLERD